MRFLFVTTISNTINAFLIPHIKLLINEGHTVDIACNVVNEIDKELLDFGCKIHNIQFQRQPFSWKNILSIRKMKKIILENDYEIIHTHTPIASFCVRFACRKLGRKVIYTAHGFHFFKGASWKNWLIIYPLEKIAARWTDAIITINEEDYHRAVKFKVKSNLVFLVNGVGVDLTKFNAKSLESKVSYRKKYGYKLDQFLLIYVGELSHRKNQIQLLKSVNLLKNKIPNIKLLLVGNGPLKNKYEQFINKHKLNDYVDMLGYRKDIPELMHMSDIIVSTSRQEGLPVNVMEGMALEKPIIVTNARGNRDLIKNKVNGYIVELDNSKQFANFIEKLYSNPNINTEFGKRNSVLVQKYSNKKILEEMKEIYSIVVQKEGTI